MGFDATLVFPGFILGVTEVVPRDVDSDTVELSPIPVFNPIGAAKLDFAADAGVRAEIFCNSSMNATTNVRFIVSAYFGYSVMYPAATSIS